MTKKRSLAIGAVAFAALVALAACGDSAGGQADQETTSASPTTTTSAAAEAHNQVDVTFAQHMIPHHQQAIEMSDMILAKQDVDPRVVELANQIKAAQGPEIEQMQGWLTQWGLPTMPRMPGMEMPGQTGMPGMESPTATPTTTTAATPSPTGMPGMPGMPMAGMMSPEDMAALQNAQGVDASTLFMTQMIEHHQGAITMAQSEIDSGQYPPAITLARSIIDAQQTEIDTMQGILATL